MVAVEGGNASLVCGEDLVSRPPATVTWSDSRGNSPRGDARVQLDNGPSSVSLRLRGVTRGDAGNWICSLHVEGVRTVEISITLTVLGKS